MNTDETLFESFGGIAKMAAALRLPVTTVASWKAAGRIPAGKQPLVLTAINELGIPLGAESVIFPMGTPAAQQAQKARP